MRSDNYLNSTTKLTQRTWILRTNLCRKPRPTIDNEIFIQIIRKCIIRNIHSSTTQYLPNQSM